VDGEWVIEIYSDGQASGAYSFAMAAVPAVDVRPITVGETMSGATSAIGEWDQYSFNATAGDIVYLDALGDCVDDLWWRLLRPDGAMTTFQTICTDIGRRVLDVDGDWAIEIYSDGQASGAYSFATIAVPDVDVRAVTVGETVTAATGAIGEWDRYTFTATAGEIVYLDALGDCVDDLWWRLVRPDGVLSTFQNICTDIGRRALDVDGEWAIEIYSDGQASGAYSFTLSKVP
jgi:hypothetical protein